MSPLGDETVYLQDTTSVQNNPKNGVVTLQHTFSPKLLEDLKFAANRTPSTTQNVPVLPIQVQATGLTTLHDNLFQVLNSTAYSLVETVDLSFGKHSITT